MTAYNADTGFEIRTIHKKLDKTGTDILFNSDREREGEGERERKEVNSGR